MNLPPQLSDCCNAPATGDLVEHCVPGEAFGVCSKCNLTAVYKLPMPPQPRSGAGLLIGLGLFLAIPCGVTFTLGPVWVCGLTGVTAVLCIILAWRQGV